MANIKQMTMASQYLDAQISTLEAHGFSRKESLKILGISSKSLDNKYSRFDILSLIPLYKSAADVLNEPLISLQVGFDFRVATFEKTGNIYTVCDNIRQVISMNAKYQRLAIYAGDVSLICDKENERCFLDFAPFMEPTDNCFHIINLIFGAYGTAFRWLNWGSGKGLKAVQLQQTAPHDCSYFEKVFDCPIKFEQKHNRLEFFPEHLDLPFPTRDPVKRAQYQAKLDHVMNNGASAENLIKALNLTILKDLQNGSTNFNTIANNMGISEKKLRTALAKAGTSFRRQVDYVRIEHFKTLVSEGQSFANIAQELCYNDQAAFSRAFKRWYGVAPGDWTKETPLLLDFDKM